MTTQITSVTKEMLLPAAIAGIDRLIELGHSGTAMGYKDFFLALFPHGRFGNVHATIIGEACLVWENKNKKTIDWVFPTFRDRRVKGKWHTRFTTEEQLEQIGFAREAAVKQRARLQKQYGTDRVWARAYLEFTAEDLAQSEFAAV